MKFIHIYESVRIFQFIESVAADNWIAFYPQTKPFQEEDDIAADVQESLQKQNFTAKHMFKQVVF